MDYLGLLLSERPLGVWPLNELGGTVARGYGRQSTPLNGTYAATGVTFGVGGPSAAVPRGISTDGVSGAVVLPLLTGLGSAQPQTFEILLRYDFDINSSTTQPTSFSRAIGSDKPTGDPAAVLLVGSATADATNEVITVYNGNAGANDTTYWTGFTLPAGWHHHALTYDGAQNSWTYFLDGARAGSSGESSLGVFAAKASNSGGSFGFGDSYSFTIGQNASAPANYSAVTAAYVAIYSRRLADSELRRHASFALGGQRVGAPTRLRRAS